MGMQMTSREKVAMDTSKPALSLAICAFNGLEYTKLLIESIRKHSSLQHEIVVYSDGSTDGTLQWLRQQPDIRWQHDQRNRGICTAMNRVAAMCSGKYLFFPNTDHVLAPGWDRALLSWLDERTVVSAQCIEPGIVPVARIFHTRNCGTRWDEFNETEFVRAASDVQRVESTPGVNYPFAISRALWDEVGGLDEFFNPGPANDPDLFYRLHFVGARMIRAENFLVYHFSGKSSRLAGEAKTEHREWHEITERNEVRFREKWGEPYQYANGGLPNPGAPARSRWTEANKKVTSAIVVDRMRVAIDARSISPKMHGIGIYASSLIRALAEDKSRPEIHCIVNDKDAAQRALGNHPGLILQAVSTDPSRSLVADELGFLGEPKFNVFHGPSFSVPPGLAVPSIVTVHDLIFRKFPQFYPRGFVEHMEEVLTQALSLTSAIICVSRNTEQDLHDALPEIREKTRVVYEALPEGFQVAEDAGEIGRVKEKWSAGRDFILSVGVQQRRKNAAGLIQAYSILRQEKRIDLRLLLVGGAESEDPELGPLIDRLGLGSDVTLTPHIPDPEIQALYAGCKAFAFASFSEGFGFPLLEAMASKAPVICSTGGALPEIAGGAAVLCSPEDPKAFAKGIADAIGKPALRDRLILRGLKRVEDFSWQRAAQETIEVYKNACAPQNIGEVRGSGEPNPPLSQPIEPIPAQVKGPVRYRIALDCRMLKQTQTGTGRYSYEIVSALLNEASDAEFVLVGPEQLDGLEFMSQERLVRHVAVGSDTLLNAQWEQFSLPEYLQGCDLYFAPTGILPVTAPCKGVPVVHDLGYEDRPEGYAPELRSHLSVWVKNACRVAERVIAVSSFTAGRLQAIYKTPAARIRVVHHGAPKATSLLAKPSPRPYVLCVSSFESNKNQPVLVQAFARISTKWSGRLVLAGRPGTALDSIVRMVSELGLRKRIDLVVGRSDSEISALYAGASLFVFPSTYEGFGLPLIEAMAAGLPIISSDSSSCGEVLGDGAFVLKNPSAENYAKAMEEVLLGNTGLGQELRMKALKRSSEFNWEKAAKETWKTLRECLEPA